MSLALIRLMDMGFKWLFSDPHSMYLRLRPTGESGFNQIDGHGFQMVVL